MRSNTKSSTKKKPGKVTAAVVSDSSPKKQIVLNEGAKPKPASKNKLDENPFPGTIAVDSDTYDATDVESHNELYTLRYDINERGIGKILLPPSLSTLLQSDRVAISPAAGGLFIRSL